MVNPRFETLKNEFYKNSDKLEKISPTSKKYEEILVKNRKIAAEIYEIACSK